MKFIYLFISCFLFVSCSNLSKNFVRKGEFQISSGKVGNNEWEDDLVFKRYSWFKELTLVYDLIVVRIDQNSPYYNWFSSSEKEVMNKCKDNFVVITYAQNDDNISKSDMMEQFKSLGYSRYALREFKRNLKMHPDYELLRLQLYKVDGICQESFQKNALSLSFPGFKSFQLSL